jgi:hypothetical protein
MKINSKYKEAIKADNWEEGTVKICQCRILQNLSKHKIAMTFSAIFMALIETIDIFVLFIPSYWSTGYVI